MMVDRETWLAMFPGICPACGGNGVHGMVHVRTGNGGGHNRPCPRGPESADSGTGDER